MNPRIFACVAVVLVACVAVVAGSAAAQNGSDGTGIEINASDVTTDEETVYAQEIDNSTRIVEWRYDDEREGFEIVFETDRSKRITITEAVQFSEGSGSGRIYQERLPDGTTEVFVSVPRRGGQAAVTLVTSSSIRQNRFSYISTGETTPNRPAITFERVMAIVFLTAAASAGGAFGLVKRRREDEEMDLERII